VIRRPALVGAFAARLMLLPLGQRFIVTGDEARFANLAQDMLARGIGSTPSAIATSPCSIHGRSRSSRCRAGA
jgi:hypothetical protein